MEDQNADNKQDGTTNDFPSTLANIQIVKKQRAPRTATQHPKDKKPKKWTLRRHWQEAPRTRQVKWIFEGCGLFVGICVLGTYVLSLFQTKHNFAIEHQPRVYLSSPIQAMLVRVGPDPDKRVYFIGFFPIKNSGSLPAVHLIGAGEIIPGGDDQDLARRGDDWFAGVGLPLLKKSDPSSGMWIMKNGVGAMEFTLPEGQIRPFGIHQIKQVSVESRLPAVAVARIQYEDGSGNSYWTDACYILPIGFVGSASGNTEGSSITIPCAKHNEIH